MCQLLLLRFALGPTMPLNFEVMSVSAAYCGSILRHKSYAVLLVASHDALVRHHTEGFGWLNYSQKVLAQKTCICNFPHIMAHSFIKRTQSVSACCKLHLCLLWLLFFPPCVFFFFFFLQFSNNQEQ